MEIPAFRRVAAALAALLVLAGCGKPASDPPSATAPAPDAVTATDPAAPATTAAPRRPAADPAWVTIADPKRAQPGYTLTLLYGRTPVLLDLAGRIVHAWPQARVKSRVRLLEDGSILGIGLGRLVVAYDWDGREIWTHRTPHALPHHDVERLRNGNTLLLVLVDGEAADTLVEVDPAGREVWRWRAVDHLDALVTGPARRKRDLTHINSVQELPENPWFTAGDVRFRPGNLLVSARNVNTVFIVERPGGKIVWSYGAGLDRQHEARMSGLDLPAPGLVAVFNNRRGSFRTDRRSELLEFDPRTGAAVWRWTTAGFYSSIGGTQQALANGNLLVTSTQGRRVFEVTRDGDLVWEWATPFTASRALRVAPDACPQLARLAPPTVVPVVPAAGYRYVDPKAYAFARARSRRGEVIDGTRREVLENTVECAELLLPSGGMLHLAFGLDRMRLAAATPAAADARFTVTVEDRASGRRETLFAESVGVDGSAWRERTVLLDAWELAEVSLCVAIEGDAATQSERRFAWWQQPNITTAADRAAVAGTDDDGDGDGGDTVPEDLDAEEREARLRHLRALGYVD